MTSTIKQNEVKNIPSINSYSTVQEAVDKMRENHSEAVVVMENARLAGIFSEHELFEKVVASKLDLSSTQVKDVMTVMPPAIDENFEAGQALSLMFRNECHYLPVINRSGCIYGILSLNDLEEMRLKELNEQNKTLLAYISADGMGGC